LKIGVTRYETEQEKLMVIPGNFGLVKYNHHSNQLVAHPDYTGFATDKGTSWSGQLKENLSNVADELALKLGIAR